MNKYERLNIGVKNWLEDRPLMKVNNADLTRLSFLLLGEAQELLEEIVMGTEMEKILQELADVLLYAFSMVMLVDADAYSIMMDKMAYNYLRFPANEWQSGEYKDAYTKGKLRQASVYREYYGVEEKT